MNNTLRFISQLFSSMIVCVVSMCLFPGIAQENPESKPLLTAESVQQLIEQTAQKVAKKTAKETAIQILKQLKPNTPTSPPAEPALQPPEETLSDKATPYKTNTHLVSIGSGSVGGNYFVLGELVGGVISHPVGSLPCGGGGTCGVPNTQSVNITSAGSIANLSALENGEIASGFVQSDVAYWAYTGTGLFENKAKMADLRAIASLYPEAVHIVVRKAANIESVSDMKGKRVSVGARKSGTLLQARLVLEAYSLNEDDLLSEYLNNQQSIAKLQNGDLDAMFFSVGVPAPALTQLFAENTEFSLLSLDSNAQEKIFKKGSYFSPYVIDSDTYPQVGKVETISVFALWLCSSKQDSELIYQMTKALWSDTSRQLLNSSYIGRKILIENSLQGIGIPLHDGAKKYYNEIGKRF